MLDSGAEWLGVLRDMLSVDGKDLTSNTLIEAYVKINGVNIDQARVVLEICVAGLEFTFSRLERWRSTQTSLFD